MSRPFEGKVALVTGGSSGIGAATALHFAQAGARVLITGRHEAPLRAVAANHDNLVAIVADVADHAATRRLIEDIAARHGRLDVLVNNAGIVPMALLDGATPEHVRTVFDVNVGGLIETTRLALPLLRAARGAVVNVASTVADEPFAHMSVYSASKAAVLALTRAWAKELAADGVRVNAVSPGPIATPVYDPAKLGITPATLEALGAAVLAKVPLGRFGQSEEVAQVIAFLASPAASFVTGAQYTVGGGMEA